MNSFELAKLYSPNLPWCNDDPEKLGKVVIDFVLDQETYRRRWCQKWFENMNFVYGNQHLKWSQRFDFAVDVDFLRRESPLSQRSITNISRTVLEALASMIYGDIPTWDVDTADESSLKGKRFKKICEKLLEAYGVRLLLDKELFDAAVAFCAFGQVAAKIDWNPKAGQLMDIPQWRKAKVPIYTTGMMENPYLAGLLETPTPALDSMGNPRMEQRWEPLLDASGKQAIKKVPAGDARLSILTPFEYSREIGSAGFHKSKFAQHIRLMDFDEFLYEYEDHDGKTKFWKNVKPSQTDALLHGYAVRHFMRMQYVTPPSLLDTWRRTESVIKGSLFKNKIIVVEHYDRPHEKWPQGRKLVIANGVCTHVSKNSYSTNKPDGWHPFVEAQWLKINPSSMATGPLNDVVAKNKENNVKDKGYYCSAYVWEYRRCKENL